ncbi:MAG: apolipoprotein N-acyltransferase [Myxococcota bacterium]|nr:apolipoprotein N-acyltransferase [Myxococcota bacterium]
MATRPSVSGGTRAELVFGVGYLVVTLLSFPHPVFGTVIDLGIAASWLSPAFLLLSTSDRSPGSAALRGLGLGLVAHAGVLHWAYVVTVHYGNAHPLLGVLAPFGMALYPALFTAAFAASAAWLVSRGAGSLFVLAALWVALDHGRSWFLGGFPWATIGYAQHLNRWLLGIVTVTGVYGLSFAVALGGATLARIARERRLSREAALALGVVIGLHLLGPWMRAAEPGPDAPSLRIAAVQGNVDQRELWSPARFERTLDEYEQGTRAAGARGARIAVWPESAVAAAVEYEYEVQQRIEALARETRSVLVFGSVGTAVHAEGGIAYQDSAFAVDANGEWIGRYDKTHLVPFGEYVPLRWLIGRIATALATGISSRDILPGERPASVTLRLEDPVMSGLESAPPSGLRIPPVSSVRVGIPICYELLFPDLVRRFVRDGAGVLLAITNDAWYGRTGAPYQFLAMTALRSAETGLWTVRAANTGVSAAIDASGRVRERTRIFEPALLVADVPLRAAGSPPTFYVRFGDLFAEACWGAVAVAFGWGFRRGRRAGTRSQQLGGE